MECLHCKKIKPEESFTKTKRFKLCYECKRIYDRNYYQKTKIVRVARKKETVKNRRLYNKHKKIKYLKLHPCIECGESDPIVLDFDHIKDKKFNISYMLQGHSWRSIMKEIKKCQVLCSNCHRRKTHNDMLSRK